MKTLVLSVIALICVVAGVRTTSAQLVAKPEDVAWKTATAAFDAMKMLPGKWAKVVDDPKAISGKAIAVKVGEGRASNILAGGWAPVKTDAKYAAAFRLRMDLSVTPDTDVAKVLYPGTESLAATFHMASPLRLEAVHRTKADDPATETVVTYGKNWMSVAGLQVKRDGVELVRRHPEWCQWMVNGHPKWSFNVDEYRWGVDKRRERTQTKGKQDIGLVAVNCYVPECVKYGCEEIARSAARFGWDGVRFDDHFTLESVFDGGILFDGQSYENGEDFETLSTRNNRMTREITRAANPHFLLGFNYGACYAERGIRHPEAFAETARDGGFVMLEWSGWWPGMVEDLRQDGDGSGPREPFCAWPRRRRWDVSHGFQEPQHCTGRPLGIGDQLRQPGTLLLCLRCAGSRS